MVKTAEPGNSKSVAAAAVIELVAELAIRRLKAAVAVIANLRSTPMVIIALDVCVSKVAVVAASPLKQKVAERCAKVVTPICVVDVFDAD